MLDLALNSLNPVSPPLSSVNPSVGAGDTPSGVTANANTLSGVTATSDTLANRDLDRELILATQSGLPLVSRPYHAIADQLGIAATEVQARLAAMLADGRIRRIGAVPNHYAIGYTANGMSVWDIDDSRIDELGAQVGALSFVTHCYRRPRRLPLWPYNLFAMVHGTTREQVEADIAKITGLLGDACRKQDVLYSSRILKKTGLRLGGA